MKLMWFVMINRLFSSCRIRPMYQHEYNTIGLSTPTDYEGVEMESSHPKTLSMFVVYDRRIIAIFLLTVTRL